MKLKVILSTIFALFGTFCAWSYTITQNNVSFFLVGLFYAMAILVHYMTPKRYKIVAYSYDGMVIAAVVTGLSHDDARINFHHHTDAFLRKQPPEATGAIFFQIEEE